jgi:hypothetical protein
MNCFAPRRRSARRILFDSLAVHFSLHSAWKLNLILLCYCLFPRTNKPGRRCIKKRLTICDSDRDEIAARRYSMYLQFSWVHQMNGLWLSFKMANECTQWRARGERSNVEQARRQHRGQLIMQRQRTTFRHFGLAEIKSWLREIESWFAF